LEQYQKKYGKLAILIFAQQFSFIAQTRARSLHLTPIRHPPIAFHASLGKGRAIAATW
jgi:hypothetical protein